MSDAPTPAAPVSTPDVPASTPAAPVSTPDVPASTPVEQSASKPVQRVGSLYVADLHKSVTESILYNFFLSLVGASAIASIRVCKDSQTRDSLGYAYANFHKYEDAQKAISGLNNTPIIPGGTPCRITWSRRDPSIRKSGVGNVFIKNLDKEIDNEALYDAFESFGEILSCKVAVDLNGVSRGFGFVHFAKPEDSQAAIAALNDKCFNGKQVFVGPFIPKDKRPVADVDHYTNIYLKHINPEVSAEQFNLLVAKITEDIGKITSPKLMVEVTEKDGQRVEKSKRFGFVNFENHEVAVRALERFKDDAKVKEIAPEFVAPEKTLYANRAIPRNQRLASALKQQNLNLYIKNLPDALNDEQLRDLFKEFGTIGSAVVMCDPETNASKCFGFVCFESPDSAAQAINKMNLSKIGGKTLYVALAQSKEFRARHLATMYQSRNMAPPMRQMMYPPYYNPNNMRNFGPQNPNFRGGYPRGGPMGHTRTNNNGTHQSALIAQKDQLAHQLFAKIQGETSEHSAKIILGTLLGSISNVPQAIGVLSEYLSSSQKCADLIRNHQTAE